jgi:hypothetical protein
LDPTSDVIMAAFRRYGVSGPVAEASPRAADEAVFVVTPEGAASMQEDELTKALQILLGRKVWVTTDGRVWKGKTRPL